MASQIKKDIVIKVISNLLPVLDREVEMRNNQCESYVKFPNGNLISIVLANNNARGHKFNGIIIDFIVNKEIVDMIIMPHLIPLFDEDNGYKKDDNPLGRLYYCNIDKSGITESIKYSFDISPINYNKEIFKKEYQCMFYENDYDKPVVEKELNGDKVMLYEAWGIPKDLITYSTEFINKTKQTYLNVSGKHEIPDLGFENDLNIRLFIDTDIYDGYKVHVEDGLVTVVLHEIKNEAPVLKDYGVA